MATLQVTKAELQYLVDVVGATYHWPQRSADIGADMLAFIPIDKQKDPGGGPSLRLRLFALLSYGRRNTFRWPTMPLELSVQELWLVESMLWAINGDLRTLLMEDKQPFITFAIKVWDALIIEHADDLPDYLRMSTEESDAGTITSTNSYPDESTRRSAIEGADSAIAAVEAALAESRAGQGAE